MGMYTKFSIDLKLRDDVPPEVRELMYVFFTFKFHNLEPHEPEPEGMDHPFWKTSRFEYFSYGDWSQEKDLGIHYYDFPKLNIRVDVKDYDHEIAKFLDWVSPYVESASKGRKRYEEMRESTEVLFDAEYRRFKLKHPTNPEYNLYNWGCTPDEEQQEDEGHFEFIPKFE